jgi:hypothetical protein
MLIINGGLPRSGTVLTGRIISEVLRHNSCQVENINLDSVNRVAKFVKRAVHSGIANYKNIVLHTHSWADGEFNEALSLGNTKIFWNYRDPRDILVSLMKLHDLSYEVYNNAPEALVSTIAGHLQVPVDLSTVSTIVSETSKENASQIMHDVASTKRTVKTLRNSARTLKEDAKTFINDRHIQSGIAGRFRQELSDEEIKVFSEKVAPFLKRFGYPMH